jgi:tetratricopeptide (TPR) repeat protein
MREWVANSLIRRGDRYLEKGRYDEASKAYDQAEDIQPEKQQVVARRRRQLELVPDYDRAMRAHEAGDWITAEKEWLELYAKDRDYARKDGKKVAVLLAEAVLKREGISKHRQRLVLALFGLAVFAAALSLWLGWGSVVTSGQIGTGPMALVIRTATPITRLTPAPLPTNSPDLYILSYPLSLSNLYALSNTGNIWGADPSRDTDAHTDPNHYGRNSCRNSHSNPDPSSLPYPTLPCPTVGWTRERA